MAPEDRGQGGQYSCASSLLQGLPPNETADHDVGPGDFETWLSGSTEDAFKLARSYAADQMRIVQSGSGREDLLRAA